MNTLNWIEAALVPITSVVTWLAARRKRRNDAIADLQCTIDMLVQKNNTIYKELIDTRNELAQARLEIDTLKANQEKLLSENSELKNLIEKQKK